LRHRLEIRRSRPAGESPARPTLSPAGRQRALRRRRQRRQRYVGTRACGPWGEQPRKVTEIRMPKASRRLKVSASPPGWGEGATRPARWTTMARARTDGPGTWEALHLLREYGDPVITLRRVRVCGRRRARPRSSARREGRSCARGTGAATDGDQGVGGLHTSVDVGERKAPGPGRPKAARAVTNFGRGTWPAH